MQRRAAAWGSAAFFVAAPCVVAGLVPWLLTRWSQVAGWPQLLRAVGVAVLVLASVVLVRAFSRFVTEGRGTPAPVAPTEALVVGDLYRHVRNPMYLAVVWLVLGQWMVLGRPVLLAYAVMAWVVMALFVRWYEEPALRRRFGAPYDDYRRGVRAWVPRVRRWDPTGPADDH